MFEDPFCKCEIRNQNVDFYLNKEEEMCGGALVWRRSGGFLAEIGEQGRGGRKAETYTFWCL